MWKVLILVAACGSILHAESKSRLTTEDVLQKITNLIQCGSPDAEIAGQVQRMNLSERLSNDEFRWLEKSGAGPRALEAFVELQRHSMTLPLPAEPAIAFEPNPTNSYAAQIFSRVAEYAANYLTKLIDFRCVLTTQKRMGKPTQPGEARSAWKRSSKYKQDIGFYQGREISEKGNPPGMSRSVWTQGEFATVMQATFAKVTEAAFHWDHWERLHGKRYAVFAFAVDRLHSRLQIDTEIFESSQWQHAIMSPAYRGYIYADPKNGEIARITVETDNIPQAYLLNNLRAVFNYGPVELGGRQFLLLTDSTAYLETKQYKTLLEKRFSAYRKFETDSKLVIK